MLPSELRTDRHWPPLALPEPAQIRRDAYLSAATPARPMSCCREMRQLDVSTGTRSVYRRRPLTRKVPASGQYGLTSSKHPRWQLSTLDFAASNAEAEYGSEREHALSRPASAPSLEVSRPAVPAHHTTEENMIFGRMAGVSAQAPGASLRLHDPAVRHFGRHRKHSGHAAHAASEQGSSVDATDARMFGLQVVSHPEFGSRAKFGGDFGFRESSLMYKVQDALLFGERSALEQELGPAGESSPVAPGAGTAPGEGTGLPLPSFLRASAAR
mmetsp:Transcript_45560/g.120373  ORF Transcript_45560/g.120373 Transcript_45560/m.120373 type:complete len:271 (-) Transcript_45560:73-885(-)